MTRSPRLPQTFFDRTVLKVAPELLGKFLVRRSPDGEMIAQLITEVEAYDGEKDLACHIPKKHMLRTPRIGVEYAGKWAQKPYRFVVSES